MSRASVSHTSAYWEIGESEPHRFEAGPLGFEPWSSKINDSKIDTWRFPAWRSALLGQGKDCLAPRPYSWACPTTLKHSFTPRRITSGNSDAAIAADIQPVPRKRPKPFIIHKPSMTRPVTLILNPQSAQPVSVCQRFSDYKRKRKKRRKKGGEGTALPFSKLRNIVPTRSTTMYH